MEQKNLTIFPILNILIYVHKELKKSSFCRSFSVGNNIDKEKLNAKFNNGILTITLPKIVPDPKKEDPKRIEIN